MSDNSVFLPIINQNQYNLLISLANTFLKENLADLSLLVRNGQDNPLNTDTNQADLLIEQISQFKLLITILLEKQSIASPASVYPIRIEFPTHILLTLHERLITIYRRYHQLLNPGELPVATWWSNSIAVDKNNIEDLMVTIGSLEAIAAQSTEQYYWGMTIMTGSRDQ